MSIIVSETELQCRSLVRDLTIANILPASVPHRTTFAHIGPNRLETAVLPLDQKVPYRPIDTTRPLTPRSALKDIFNFG